MSQDTRDGRDAPPDYGDWEPVIGLEVHAQLLTESKLFCGCSASFGAAPNAHTCPVCMGFPGVLPVLNERALELSLQQGAVAPSTQTQPSAPPLGCFQRSRSQPFGSRSAAMEPTTSSGASYY